MNSNINKAATEMRKTKLPIAFRLGERPDRSIDQISTGKVISKRVRRNAIINSSQDKVTERKKAAAIAGLSIGAVTNKSTQASVAPRSRAARSAFSPDSGLSSSNPGATPKNAKKLVNLAIN